MVNRTVIQRPDDKVEKEKKMTMPLITGGIGYKFLVSRCENHLFYLALLMMILCAADITLTLEILARGGIELNPIMDALIHRGLHMFVGFKVALTSLSLILLVFRGNRSAFVFFKVGHFLGALTAIYGVLVVYEIIILSTAR